MSYLSDDGSIAEELQALPQPQVLFNYLGRFDQVHFASELFRTMHRVAGPTRSPGAERGYLFEINSQIAGNQFHLHWSYSENLHRRSTIEYLAAAFVEALRVLIVHCQEPEDHLDRVLAEINFEGAEDD